MSNQTQPKKKYNVTLFPQAVELFDQICAERGTNRSERLSDLMHNDIRTLGTTDQAAQLDEILANAPAPGPKPRTPATPKQKTAPALLREWKALADDGIITPEEFEAKKTELLQR